jgi:hypothetical protein
MLAEPSAYPVGIIEIIWQIACRDLHTLPSHWQWLGARQVVFMGGDHVRQSNVLRTKSDGDRMLTLVDRPSSSMYTHR